MKSEPSTNIADADRVGPMGGSALWSPIASAPKDGSRIKARVEYIHHVGKYRNVYRWRVLTTWWGKTSHIPIYGWCHGRDVEDIDLWEPTQWLSPNVKDEPRGTETLWTPLINEPR